jgi:hypothetical protein
MLVIEGTRRRVPGYCIIELQYYFKLDVIGYQ